MVKRLALVVVGIAILSAGVIAAIFIFPKFMKGKSAQKTAEDSGSSIGSLMASSKNRRCEYKFNLEEGEGVGVAYIGEDAMRNDLKVSYKSGNSFEEHTIVQGPTAYFWNSMASNGTMLQIDLAKGKTQTGLDRLVDSKCSDWTQDPNKFKVPANIQFNQVAIGKPVTNGVVPPASTESAAVSSPTPAK